MFKHSSIWVNTVLNIPCSIFSRTTPTFETNKQSGMFCNIAICTTFVSMDGLKATIAGNHDSRLSLKAIGI